MHHLHRQEDYRLTSTRATNTYFVPNNERTRQKLFTLFTRLTPHEVVKGARLNVVGTRYITIPYKSGLCAMFSFWDLCSDEKALGPADYAAIARTYHTVFINGIPKIGLINRHEGLQPTPLGNPSTTVDPATPPPASLRGGDFGRGYFGGKFSSLRKVAKFSPGPIWGFWQCSVCVKQCELWVLQGWRNLPPPKFSPAK